MAGRPSKPVDLILMEGKNHITKAEIEVRKNAEAALRAGGEIQADNAVKASPVAFKEFKRLKKLYSKIEFVDAFDQQIINRYCLALADMATLRDFAEKLDSKIDSLGADGTAFEAKDVVNLYRSIDSVIGKIQAQEKQLLAFEDRLFLNPAGRMRSIPKKPEKKGKSGFAAYKEKWNQP